VVRGIEFYNRKEIKDLLAYLKVLVNPEDEISLLRIINTPTRGIGKVTADRIKQFATAKGMALYHAMGLVEQIETLSASPKTKVKTFYSFMEKVKTENEGSVAALAERLLTDSGMEASLLQLGSEGKDALDNVSELINSAARYDEQAEEGSLLDYLQEISLFSDTDAYDAASQRVALMTLHAAKGLEFSDVCIVGLEEGLLPHERSVDDEDELEEERRLFFVGLTRAQEGLHISYAKYRTVRGQTLRSIPSKFLYELGVDLFGTDSSNDQDKDLRRESQAVSLANHQTAETSEAEFSKGDLVQHKRFGLGRVQKYANMGAGSIVTVQFNSGITKSLMLKYANLTKVTK
jgi:DNA helicase-2/ATP-dependent DNA helicase PcrA